MDARINIAAALNLAIGKHLPVEGTIVYLLSCVVCRSMWRFTRLQAARPVPHRGRAHHPQRRRPRHGRHPPVAGHQPALPGGQGGVRRASHEVRPHAVRCASTTFDVQQSAAEMVASTDSRERFAAALGALFISACVSTSVAIHSTRMQACLKEQSAVNACATELFRASFMPVLALCPVVGPSPRRTWPSDVDMP